MNHPTPTHIDRTADEISGIQVGTGYESVTIGIDAAREAARALDAAGLLASPSHDAAVAARALREAADEMRHIFLHKGTTLGMPADDWLLDRADSIDRIERPATCCGKCPPIAGGGYDCTCEGNPRCKCLSVRPGYQDCICTKPRGHDGDHGYGGVFWAQSEAKDQS
ncbi:hypothetical protein [Janibacter sp. LM]|uniref:hypothetical protein n=1 Tax=Janibacter sp. LM TaxID=3144845 RepID=UPI0031F6D8BB